MRHIKIENLVNYVDGVALDVDKVSVETHLTACNECAELKQELQILMMRLQEDSSLEPPAELLQWGINLFQPVMQPKTGPVRRLIASLVFDTFDQPMLAGMRRVGTPPRQLLFRAGDVDVDVKIEAMEEIGRASCRERV